MKDIDKIKKYCKEQLTKENEKFDRIAKEINESVLNENDKVGCLNTTYGRIETYTEIISMINIIKDEDFMIKKEKNKKLNEFIENGYK